MDSTLLLILVDNTIMDAICYHDRVAGFGVTVAKCNVEFLHCNIVRYRLGQEHVASSLKEVEAMMFWYANKHILHLIATQNITIHVQLCNYIIIIICYSHLKFCKAVS